jgi:hypothetical protein
MKNIMINKKNIFFLGAFVMMSSLCITYVGASPLQQGLEEFGAAEPGLVIDSNLVIYVSTIFRWFLGLIGTVLFLLLAYGGLVYMTAGGNESDTKKAVGIISNAIIGIIILFAAWLVSDYVVSAILAVAEGAAGG